MFLYFDKALSNLLSEFNLNIKIYFVLEKLILTNVLLMSLSIWSWVLYFMVQSKILLYLSKGLFGSTSLKILCISKQTKLL